MSIIIVHVVTLRDRATLCGTWFNRARPIYGIPVNYTDALLTVHFLVSSPRGRLGVYLTLPFISHTLLSFVIFHRTDCGAPTTRTKFDRCTTFWWLVCTWWPSSIFWQRRPPLPGNRDWCVFSGVWFWNKCELWGPIFAHICLVCVIEPRYNRLLVTTNYTYF